ncbi:MAG: hypothetical protein RJQ21_15505 [Rhodospirillales bacterium]|jgi:hypothetical protein
MNLINRSEMLLGAISVAAGFTLMMSVFAYGWLMAFRVIAA